MCNISYIITIFYLYETVIGNFCSDININDRILFQFFDCISDHARIQLVCKTTLQICMIEKILTAG